MASSRKFLSSVIQHMRDREDDPLRPLIDEYLIKRDLSPDRLREYNVPIVGRPRPHGRISPSAVGGCERQAVFRFVGLPGERKLDPDSELVFDDGNWRHHRWQATFLDMQAVLGAHVIKVLDIEGLAVYEPLYVRGHLDALLKLHAKRRYVIDIKGANEYVFQMVVRDREPLRPHVAQLIMYMKARRCRRGILLYEGKNNNLIAGFVIEFDEEEWADAVEWCESVLGFLTRRRIPPRHEGCVEGRVMLERCPWAGTCFGGMTRREIRELTYTDFVSIEAAWAEGQELE